MKMSVREQRGRTTTFAHSLYIILALLFCTAATAFAAGGKQNIIILPMTATAENLPDGFVNQLQRQLQLALVQQPGVQADILQKNSKKIVWLKSQMDQAGQEALINNFDTAVNAELSADERMKAAASLASSLGVDAVVYATVDGYEVSSKPRQVKIRVNGTAVTLERDTNGVPQKDPQGFLSPSSVPFAVVGRSKDLPKNNASIDTMNEEAINSAVTLVAQRMGSYVSPTGNEPKATTTETTKKKKSTSTWLWVLGGAALIAILGGGSGGGDKSPSTPPDVTAPVPSFVSSQIVPTSDTTLGATVVWSLAANPDNIDTVDIYRYRDGKNLSRTLREAAIASNQTAQTLKGSLNGRHRQNRKLQAYRTTSRDFTTSRSADDNWRYHGSVTSDKVLLANDKLTFYDTDLSEDGTYQYFLTVNYKNGQVKSDADYPGVQDPGRKVLLFGGKIDNIDGLAKDLSVDLTWHASAPDTAKWQNCRFVVYGTSNRIPANKTAISFDELSTYRFTDISTKYGVDLSWSSDKTFTFSDVFPGTSTMKYVVVAFTGDTPISGPYKIQQVSLPISEFTGTIGSYSLSLADSSAYKVYYSASPADQLSLSNIKCTDILVSATDSSFTKAPAAGAVVVLTASIGSFVPFDDQVIIPGTDDQKIKCRLDANGSTVIRLQGSAADLSRSTMICPNRTDLGPVSIDALCNGTTATNIPFAGTRPRLVGPPAKILLTSSVPSPAVPQEDDEKVLFQNTQMTVTATVYDAADQTVQGDMPIWFTQSWTVLNDSTAEGSDAYFAAAKGPVAIDNNIERTDSNGQVSATVHGTEFSGKFKIYAVAVKKLTASQELSLREVTTDTVNGGYEYAKQSIDSYLLHTNAGTKIEQSTPVWYKTFAGADASQWKQIQPATVLRVNCADSTVGSTLTFTAYDDQGKRVLPGVYFGVQLVRPVPSGSGGGTLEPTGMIKATESYTVDGETVYKFGSNGIATFNVVGNNIVGQLYPMFRPKSSVLKNCLFPTNVVTMYGPELGLAYYYPIKINFSGSYYDNQGIIPRLVAQKEDNDIQPKQFSGTFSLFDMIKNKFPRGYLFDTRIYTYDDIAKSTLTSKSSGMRLSPPAGETDDNGQYTFTYDAPQEADSNGLTVEELVFKMQGENRSGVTDIRSTDDDLSSPLNQGSPFYGSDDQSGKGLTVYVESLRSVELIPYGSIVTKDNTSNIHVYGYADYAHTYSVLPGYNLKAKYIKYPGDLDATTGETSFTLGNYGANFDKVWVKAGSKSGTMIVEIYYRNSFLSSTSIQVN